MMNRISNSRRKQLKVGSKLIIMISIAIWFFVNLMFGAMCNQPDFVLTAEEIFEMAPSSPTSSQREQEVTILLQLDDVLESEYDDDAGEQQDDDNLQDEEEVQVEQDKKDKIQIEETDVQGEKDDIIVIDYEQSEEKKFYNVQEHQPPFTKGAFIHLGKTGGSSISNSLLRNGCHSFQTKPCINDDLLPPSRESYVSKLTTYYHIPDFQNRRLHRFHNRKHTYDFFLITLRDPLQRAISSFYYTHPTTIAADSVQSADKRYLKSMWKKAKTKDLGGLIQAIVTNMAFGKSKKYTDMYSCFDTVEQYAQLIHNHTSFTGDHGWEEYLNESDCENVAKSTLHHMDSNPIIHHKWDLQLILLLIHQNLRHKTILVTRQGFLWDDWISANRYLGQKGEIYIPEKSVRISNDLKIPDHMKPNKTLSETGRENLCRALEKEYKLYLRLLVFAANLSGDDVQKSLSIARRNCPCLDLRLPEKDEVVKIDVSLFKGLGINTRTYLY